MRRERELAVRNRAGEKGSCYHVLQCTSTHDAWPRVPAWAASRCAEGWPCHGPQSAPRLSGRACWPLAWKCRGEMSLEFCFLACSSGTNPRLDKKFLFPKVMSIVLILYLHYINSANLCSFWNHWKCKCGVQIFLNLSYWMCILRVTKKK